MRICSYNQLTGTDSRVLSGGPPVTAGSRTPWGLSMADNGVLRGNARIADYFGDSSYRRQALVDALDKGIIRRPRIRVCV
jgi:hypothetical protein